MDELIEDWKEVNGYTVSNYGVILGKKGKPLKFSKNKYGYVICDIDLGEPYGKVKSVHRAVAKLFVENPNNYNEVNHIDANKENNRADNLEWVTHQENMTHVSVNRLQPLHRPVCLLDNNYNIVSIFNSAHVCANELDISRIGVSNTCNGKKNTINGMLIRFYDEENNTYIKTKYETKDMRVKGLYKRKIRCIETGDITNTQQKMASLLKISQVKISNVLTGKTSNAEGYHFEYIEWETEKANNTIIDSDVNINYSESGKYIICEATHINTGIVVREKGYTKLEAKGKSIEELEYMVLKHHAI